MKLPTMIAMLGFLVVGASIRLPELAAEQSDGSPISVEDSADTSGTPLPDGVYWGQLQDFNVDDGTVLFLPLCTGLIVSDLDKLPADEQYLRRLQSTASTELWYFALTADGTPELPFYDRAWDLEMFSTVIGDRADAHWSLRLRQGAIAWIEEDGLRAGDVSCETGS